MFKLTQVLLLTSMLIAVNTASGQAPALPAEDVEAIRTVIESQLAAFAGDDAQTAFSFASKSIRETFGTADNFMAMVKSSYPVVYRPASVRFLEAEKISDEIVQSVEMADEADHVWLAIYRMQRQPDNTWRIGGCVLKRLEGTRS